MNSCNFCKTKTFVFLCLVGYTTTVCLYRGFQNVRGNGNVESQLCYQYCCCFLVFNSQRHIKKGERKLTKEEQRRIKGKILQQGHSRKKKKGVPRSMFNSNFSKKRINCNFSFSSIRTSCKSNFQILGHNGPYESNHFLEKKRRIMMTTTPTSIDNKTTKVKRRVAFV